jgi:hypothetical protein
MDLPVESVIDQIFNASLSDRENAARIRDALSLYGLPAGELSKNGKLINPR